MTIEQIRRALQEGRWFMTRHARERESERRIGVQELAGAFAGGQILEEYSDDPRGPSALLLGHSDDGRALHAVCAFDPNGILLIVRVYEPQLPGWLNERRRAKDVGSWF